MRRRTASAIVLSLLLRALPALGNPASHPVALPPEVARPAESAPVAPGTIRLLHGRIDGIPFEIDVALVGVPAPPPPAAAWRGAGLNFVLRLGHRR